MGPDRHTPRAGARLVDDQLRYVKLELMADLPPIPGDLLMASENDVPAWARRKIARNRGLQIHTRLHVLIVIRGPAFRFSQKVQSVR